MKNAEQARAVVGRRLIVVGALVGLGLGWSWSVAAAEGVKIGYVNLGKLFDNYERTKASEQVLEQKGKQKQAELQGRLSELNKLRQNLDLLSDQAKASKSKELEEKSDAFQQLKTRSERDLLRERNEVAKGIFDEIDKMVSDYATANGYSLVLDQRALLFGAGANDVTDEVLKTLNDRYAARVASPKKTANP